jgi:hypothetical protein
MKRTAGVGTGEAVARPHAANNAPKTMKLNAVIKVRIANPSSLPTDQRVNLEFYLIQSRSN